MSKLLILLSTYNGEKYLRELLDSIKNQTFQNVDLLIRDDGSVDHTLSILNEYAVNNRIIIIKGENLGPAESFFELVECASLAYDYYAFCDQDDVWLPEKLSRAINKLKTLNPDNPGLYYSGQIIVDENLQVKSRHTLCQDRSYKANFIFNQMAGCTAVMNNKLFCLLKKYRPVHVFMHDAWCYKVCVTCGGNVVVDDREYILYRQHGDNTVGFNSNVQGKIKLVRSHLENSPSSYASELLKGYHDIITPQWKDFLEELQVKRLSGQIKLLFDSGICFKSVFLRMIFILKVIVKKY